MLPPKQHPGTLFSGRNIWILLCFLVLSGVTFTGCQTTLPSPIVQTKIVTQEIPGETVIQIVTPTPQKTPTTTPEPETPLPTLVVCLGQEPVSLYPYSGNSDLYTARAVQEAIYDGPIDRQLFDYQPVILEKIPSLAEGDAVFQEIEVLAGEPIVDANGNITPLVIGVPYYPVGCASETCVVEYEGEASVVMDQMVVTFKLLPGLQWADGFPLIVQDSVYAFTIAADPATPSDKFVIERTASYEALDDITVQWTGLPGFKDPTYFTNFWPPLPQHLWEKFSAEELLEAPESNQTPLGWGPYVIQEWLPGDKIILQKNANYFRAQEGLPQFETMVFRFVGEEPNANLARVLSKECDILDPTIRLSDQSPLLLELHAKNLLKAAFQTTTIWEHVDFGITPASYENGWSATEDRPNLFGDVRTRQAIAMCMDRQKAVETVFFGKSVVLDTYLPPDHPLFNNNVPRYNFDVSAASLLLEEAGWVDANLDGIREYTGDDRQIPPGTLLAFTYLIVESNQQRKQVAQILAESMAECGIQVTLETIPLAEFNSHTSESLVFGRQFDLVAWSTDIAHTCHPFLSEAIPGPENNWSGLNIAGYNNSDFDIVCNLTNTQLPGQSTADENQFQAQALFAEDLPVVPLFLYLKVAIMGPEICNFIPDAIDNDFWNIEEFSYGDCE